MKRLEFQRVSELEQKLRDLGLSEDRVRSIVRRVTPETEVYVVENDEVEMYPHTRCSAALTGGSSGWKVIYGVADVVDQRVVTWSCGPDVWKVYADIVRLRPGSAVVTWLDYDPYWYDKKIYVRP